MESALLHTGRDEARRCTTSLLSSVQQKAGKAGKPSELRREVFRASFMFFIIFVVCLMWVICVFSSMPDPHQLAEQVERDPNTVLLKVPRSFHELRRVKETLDLYQDHFFVNVLVLYTSLYLFMQAFMIPGCFFLNLLVGAVVPVLPGMLYITVLTTLGCTLNFLLSQHVLSGAVACIFPQKVQDFQKMVVDHREHLFYYLLFLRVMPLLPAWVVNVASPLARVPLWEFTVTTAIGFQPQFFSFIKAGQMLGKLHSWRDLYSWQTTVTMVLCALLSLLPVLIKPYVPQDWLRMPSTDAQQGTSVKSPVEASTHTDMVCLDSGCNV